MAVVITLTIICAVLLVLVVLAQSSKGGLSSQFGGAGSSTQMIGVKRTTDFLEKATWVLALLVLALSLTSGLLVDSQTQEEGFTSPNIENAQETTLPPVISPDLPETQEGIDNDGALEGLGEEPVAPADSAN